MEFNSADLGIGARVKHPSFGVGIVVDFDDSTIDVFFKSEGDQQISRKFEGMKIVESPRFSEEKDDSIALNEMEESLKRILKEFIEPDGIVELASKWEGGTLELKPGNPDLQSKELPIDTFWHKIVMVRDRLRVLEQNINSHEVLSEKDKVSLQQYISRIYGSLTTFNVLFAEKSDHFSSK